MDTDDDIDGIAVDDIEEDSDIVEEEDEGFIIHDNTDDSMTGSDITEESDAQFSVDESDDGSGTVEVDDRDENGYRRARLAPGINVELAHTGLCAADDLADHPIHGRRRGITTRDGFTRVQNYVDPFIRAEDTSEHLWPHNAADWGLIEYLPSQTDMMPDPRGQRHPALDQNGHETMVHRDVNAAFYYKSV